jgi:tetratricopeptide (TPR) repeat protein
VSDKSDELPSYKPIVGGQPVSSFVKGAYDGDVAYFTQHIERHPDDPVGYEKRGLASQLNDDFDEAIVDFTTAIRLAPENHRLLLLRASAYEDRADEVRPPISADLRRAAHDYSEYLSHCPVPIDGWRFRASVMVRLGEIDNAIADYTEAISRESDPYCYFRRGIVRLRRGDIDAAIEDFDETIRIETAKGKSETVGSAATPALAERGRAFAEKGEIERAIADYDAAIRSGITESANLYKDRGVARKRQRKFHEALADFDRSLQCFLLSKEKAAVLFERGTCHQALRNPKQAASDFADAVRLDPNHTDACRALESFRSSPQTPLARLMSLARQVAVSFLRTRA